MRPPQVIQMQSRLQFRSTMLVAVVLLSLLASPLHAMPPSTALPVPAHGVTGVDEVHLDPRFWIASLPQPGRVLLDRGAIVEQNERLLRLDASMHDLHAMPSTLSRAQIADWINGLSQRPNQTRFDVNGQPVPASTWDGLVDSLALEAIPAEQSTRYGLVVHRAALRMFPTNLRVFSNAGDTDIDRLQESALFPGDPVVITHHSRDGEWLFVVSPRYAAWIEADNIAEGTAEQVLGYAEKSPYRIITGPTARTVFTPEQPAVSELQLDMGVRVPVLAAWPADEAVNGQHPYSAHVVELPIRNEQGRLELVPALLPKVVGSAADYLPLTAANLIEQSFRFLGERYGWGHSYNGRDCSGFVSEVYRSFGVQVPRNTSAQAVSPALDHTVFGKAPGGEARAAAVAALQVGDLVYIPGHVMMVIGHVDGAPYVIHDTNGGSVLGADGRLRSLHLNGVSVTALLPMMFNERERYVDRMTSVVRLRTTGSAAPEVDRSPASSNTPENTRSRMK